jgi:hypothetical protein
MNLRIVAAIVAALVVSGCKPKAPEQPSKPPTPTAASAAPVDSAQFNPASDVERPTLTSAIESAGRRTQYVAYFDGTQLARIEETPEGGGPVAEYRFLGARLLRFSQTAGSDAGTVLELDDRGGVQRAMAGAAAMSQADIDDIRTRAQLLRSHALAQRASKMHAH